MFIIITNTGKGLPRENGNQDSIEYDSVASVMTQNYCILIATIIRMI